MSTRLFLSSRRLLTIALLALSIAMPAAAQVCGPVGLPQVWVDANFGSGFGNGTPGNPYLTITQGVNHVATILGGFGQVVVRPGVYDVPLGEVFPIVLPPFVEIVAEQRGGAIISGNPAPVFPGYPFEVPAGSIYAMFDGLQFERQPGVLGYTKCINVTQAPGDTTFVCITECQMGSSTASLDLHVNDSVLDVNVDHCVISAGSTPIRLQNTDGLANMTIDRTRISGGATGLSIIAAGGGTNNVRVDRSVITECLSNGIRHENTGFSTATVDVVHSVINDCGNNVFPAGAAIRDVGPTNAAWSIVNTIFWANPNELLGVPASATVLNNVMQFPFAGAVGTVVGNPLFINVAQNDFHLQPGSPAIDAGALIAPIGLSTEDIDLDPMFSGLSRDIGTDEFWGPYMSLNSWPADAGGFSSVTFWGNPGDQMHLVLGPAAVPGFGSGFQLTGIWSTTFMGNVPATGYQNFVVPVPATVFPLTTVLTFGAQGVFVGPFGGVTWALNAIDARIQP